MRIVVVSLSGALATRLNLAEPAWDVEHVAECAEVRWVHGFHGAVLDISSGLTVARPELDSLTERCGRVVVLGERDDVPEGVTVLAPPFELRDLVQVLGGGVPLELIDPEPAAPRPRRFRRGSKVRPPAEGAEPIRSAREGNGSKGRSTNGTGTSGNGRTAPDHVAQVPVAVAPGAATSTLLLDEALLRPRQEPPAPLPPRPMSAHRFGERVERALLAMDEVRGLVAEVPTLADPFAIGAAIVEEIRAEVRATTVCVLGRASGGFTVIGGVGLEEVDTQAVVPSSHPFLRALSDRGQAAYFERHGDGAAIVAGVPGATTSYVAAAQMRRDDTVIGSLLVGADTIDASVTRVLDRITREAAPALALALAIHAMRRSWVTLPAGKPRLTTPPVAR